MLSVAITPGRMETFARALDRAVANGVLPSLRIEALRSSFVATDAQGRSWTLDPESHRWGRLDGERWMFEDPPQQLFMDSELRASLEALEAMAARAIMRGADPHAPRECWFRTAAPPGNPPEIPASVPAREFITPLQPSLEREQAPLAESALSSESISYPAIAPRETLPARLARNRRLLAIERQPAQSSESISPPAIVPRETLPARPATEVPVFEHVRMAFSASSEVAGTAEPETRTSEAIRPAPDPTPVEKTAPSRPASITPVSVRRKRPATPPETNAPATRTIPEAHLRFAGPGFAPVSDDLAIPRFAGMAASDATAAPGRIPASAKLPSPVPPRGASPKHGLWVLTSIAPRLMSVPPQGASPKRERWVPPSIAPRLTSEHPEPREGRAAIFLGALITALFLTLASWKGDGRDYAGALLFGLLTVTLIALNLARTRQD